MIFLGGYFVKGELPMFFFLTDTTQVTHLGSRKIFTIYRDPIVEDSARTLFFDCLLYFDFKISLISLHCMLAKQEP